MPRKFLNEIPFPTLNEHRHRHHKNGRKIGISKILTQYGASGQEKTYKILHQNSKLFNSFTWN
jgi:hypothetical protein